MNFNIFAILKAQKGRESRLINCFMANDISNAKLYFQGYIFGEKDSIEYTLYQVGEINKWLQITPKKIYICNGFQADAKTQAENHSIEQCKIDWENYSQNKPCNNKEVIEMLFNGRLIDEERKTDISNKQMD